MSGSLSQVPPSPFANKLRLNSPAGSLLPPIPPPAPLGLPDLETVSLGSTNSRSKPTPIPPRRSPSPLRPQAFDRSMDPEEEEEEDLWGERNRSSDGPTNMARFASSFATRVNSLFSPTLEGSMSNGRMTDAELEAEAERAREQSRREAERILTEEAAERRRVEEKALWERAQKRAQVQAERERAEKDKLAQPSTPTRGMSVSPVNSPGKERKEGEGGWWGMAKSKLTPTREKDKEKEKEKEISPAQQIINDTRSKDKEKEKVKKSGDWPAQPGVRSTDPTLLAMAAASQLATSPGPSTNQFVSGALSSSPSNQPRPYSPKPIMPHEQLAREIEAQGGGRVSSDFFGTRLSSDGLLSSSPKTPLPFANRATPSPAPSPLQPARAQTSPAQLGLSGSGTPSGGRSPNASPDKSPNVDKDKRLNTLDSEKRTSTSGTTDEEAPPLYAQFTPAGALDVPLTLLTIARRFEKLEKWTVGHVRALEERMKDVERYLVDKDVKADAVGREINALKNGIQDIRRSMENIRESIPPPGTLQPPRRVTEVSKDSGTITRRSRAMSSTSASSYATAISALNGDAAAAVRTSVISLGSVEADGIDTKASVAEVVTPIAMRQPLPAVPSMTTSLSTGLSNSSTSMSKSVTSSSLGSSPSRSFVSPPPGSSSRDFKPVPMAAKEFSPPPPLSRVSSLTGDKPTSPRSRLPYPTGDYTAPAQPVTPLAAAAASFPMPPGASSSSLTLAGTAPLTIRAVDKDKAIEKESTPLAVPQSRVLRADSTSPTPRKRYTIALSGGDGERERSLPTQTATFTTSPPSGTRTRSQSTYGAPQPPPSPSPAPTGRLRRTVSSSNDGSGGLAAVFSQTEDWEDVREKVLSPRLGNGPGDAKFVDPLVVRRKGANGARPSPGPAQGGAGRGKVPISQLVKFFDGDK